MARIPLLILSIGILLLLLAIGGLYLLWDSADDDVPDRSPRFEETGEEIETRGGEMDEGR